MTEKNNIPEIQGFFLGVHPASIISPEDAKN